MHKPVITIKVSQDDTPIRGNAMVSGDDAFDKQVEDEIIERLESGDVWAWALVEVRARYGGLEAVAYLGACCYDNEESFLKDGGYLPDLIHEATADLQQQLEDLESPIKLDPADTEDLELTYGW